MYLFDTDVLGNLMKRSPPHELLKRVGDVLAFIDESGSRGYSRNLEPARDHEIGLMCALLIPAKHFENYHNAFLPGYKRFLDAKPDNAKPHITDAFTPGNECWAAIARSVRSEFHRLIHCLQISVVYDARRLAVERDSHERQKVFISQIKKLRRSPIRITDHPNQPKVEDELVLGLAIKLNAFCQDSRYQKVGLLFDEIDSNVAQKYREIIAEISNIGDSRYVVKGWNQETKSKVQREISFSIHASIPLGARFLGELHVVGKNNPLILAADIVTNSLYDHLSSLPHDAYLNRPSSIEGWNLKSRVYSVRDDAIEDII